MISVSRKRLRKFETGSIINSGECDINVYLSLGYC